MHGVGLDIADEQFVAAERHAVDQRGARDREVADVAIGAVRLACEAPHELVTAHEQLLVGGSERHAERIARIRHRDRAVRQRVALGIKLEA
jgi:hypothetical protein